MAEGEEGYDAGQAYIVTTPSFRGWDAAVDRHVTQSGNVAGRLFAKAFQESARQGLGDLPLGPSAPESSRQGDRAAGAFAAAFKRRIRAALADLPKPRVGVDATEADAELADIRAKLEALGNVTVGVDLRDDEAVAQLDILKARLDELGARSPNIQVSVDTARASAELAAFSAEVAAVGAESPTVGVDSSGIASATGEVFTLGNALIGLAPLIAPLSAALVGLAGGVTSVLAAAGAGVGIAAVAAIPVVKAVQAIDAAHKAEATSSSSTAATEISNANAIKSATASLAEAKKNAAAADIAASRQVQQARQNVAQTEQQAARAEKQAADQVRTAQQAERLAHQQVTDAIKSENAAREQAVRDLQDYANGAVDAHLNAQQAAINLTRAEQALQAAQAPGTSALDRQEAELNLAQARQALVEANQQAARSTQDNNKAQAAGVAGDANVIAASKQVASARRSEQLAIQSLQRAEERRRLAQIDGDRQIARAESNLTDALRRQHNTQRQGAYSVAQAERSLQSAETSAARGASGVNTALAKQKEALNELSPAGRTLARFLVGTVLPAFHKVQNVAGRALFPGILAGLKALSPLEHPFLQFVKSMAGAMGGLFEQLAKRLTSPWWQSFFDWVSREGPHVLTQFIRILFNLGTGFAGMLKAFGPVTNQIGRALLGLSRSFAQFGKDQGKDSPLQRFVGYVITNGPILGALFINLAQIMLNLIVAIAPLGTVLAEALVAVTGFLTKVPPAAFYALAAAVGALFFIATGTVTGFIVLIVGLTTVIAKYFPQIEAAMRHVGHAFQDVYRTVLKPVFDALGKFFGHTLPNVVGGTIDWVRSHWKLLVAIFAGPIGIVVALVSKNWGKITGVFTRSWAAIAKGASGMWGDVLHFFVAGINDVLKLLNKFIGVIDKVLGFFHLPKIPAIPLISSGVQLPKNVVAKTGVANSRVGLELMASGGRIGGGFKTNGPMAIVGEGRRQYPEYVIPTDPMHRDRAIALFHALGGQLLGFGGIVGDIGGAVSGAFHSVTGFARDVAAKGAVAAMKAAEAPIVAAIKLIPSSMFRGIVHGLFDRINSGVSNLISGSGSSGATGGGIGQYRPQILTALRMLGLPGDLVSGVLQIIAHEDGSGNLNAVNKSDINWQEGHPSVGLMQVIRGTFAANAGPLRNVGPFLYGVSTNPLANIYAGLHYANNRYGAGMIAAGGRHDAEGNYIGYDRGGMLPPGLTMAFNGTGKPEPILTSEQWAKLGTEGMSRADAAYAKEILNAIREVAPGVTEGVSGEFSRASIASANRLIAAGKKR